MGWNDHFLNAGEDEVTGDATRFTKTLNEVYDELWAFYESKDFTASEEAKLLKVINCIDDQLGR
jgi:hypothetical protein